MSNKESYISLISDEALRFAKLRETYTLEMIHSRNRLASYTPFLILYVSPNCDTLLEFYYSSNYYIVVYR
jgi:hypothetical protein